MAEMSTRKFKHLKKKRAFRMFFIIFKGLSSLKQIKQLSVEDESFTLTHIQGDSYLVLVFFEIAVFNLF